MLGSLFTFIPTWDFICWLSFESKIIKPNGGKYLHRSSKGFKFKLVARFRDDHRSTRTLRELEEWEGDKLLNITSSLDIIEGKLIKAGVGFVGGAVTGGTAACITAGIAGLGAAATESAALTMGQFLGIGAASRAVGGVAQSLATDAARKFADGEDVTLKHGHATLGAAVGAAARAAGGAVTKSVVGVEPSAASANIEGEIGEQIAILTGARRLGRILTQRIPRALTERRRSWVLSLSLLKNDLTILWKIEIPRST